MNLKLDLNSIRLTAEEGSLYIAVDPEQILAGLSQDDRLTLVKHIAREYGPEAVAEAVSCWRDCGSSVSLGHLLTAHAAIVAALRDVAGGPVWDVATHAERPLTDDERRRVAGVVGVPTLVVDAEHPPEGYRLAVEGDRVDRDDLLGYLEIEKGVFAWIPRCGGWPGATWDSKGWLPIAIPLAPAPGECPVCSGKGRHCTQAPALVEERDPAPAIPAQDSGEALVGVECYVRYSCTGKESDPWEGPILVIGYALDRADKSDIWGYQVGFTDDRTKGSFYAHARPVALGRPE